MKALKKEFIGTGAVKGFKFTQIASTNSAFLYEVNTGDKIFYEVFKKTLNKRFGVISYPSSNYFGIWAWTYFSFDKAVTKFNQLNQNQND